MITVNVNKGMYSERKAFELYTYYLGVKNHFAGTYDFFKYQGKLNASIDSFRTRKDKFSFYSLSNKSHAKDLILANFVEPKGVDWIGDMNSDEAEKIYLTWKKKIDSLSYHFKSELSEFDEDFDKNFLVEDGQHPFLLTKYLRGKVSLETLLICDDCLEFFKYWNTKISLQILWNDIYLKSKRYKPFLRYDVKGMKKIMLQHFG